MRCTLTETARWGFRWGAGFVFRSWCVMCGIPAQVAAWLDDGHMESLASSRQERVMTKPTLSDLVAARRDWGCPRSGIPSQFRVRNTPLADLIHGITIYTSQMGFCLLESPVWPYSWPDNVSEVNRVIFYIPHWPHRGILSKSLFQHGRGRP